MTCDHKIKCPKCKKQVKRNELVIHFYAILCAACGKEADANYKKEKMLANTREGSWRQFMWRD